MIETNGRNLGQPKTLRGEDAPVAGGDMVLAIDENGHIETKTLNAAGDLTDLLLCVNAGVPGVGLQTFDWHIADRQIRACVCRARRLSVSAHRCFSSFSRGVDSPTCEETAGKWACLNEQIRADYFLFFGRPRVRP